MTLASRELAVLAGDSMTVDPPELLLGLEHPGCAPAQHHGPRPASASRWRSGPGRSRSSTRWRWSTAVCEPGWVARRGSPMVNVSRRPSQSDAQRRRGASDRVLWRGPRRFCTGPDPIRRSMDTRPPWRSQAPTAPTLTCRSRTLSMGVAVLHRPCQEPGRNGTRVPASVRERGHPAGLLAGDKAYSNQKPEDFQLPLPGPSVRACLRLQEGSARGAGRSWQGSRRRRGVVLPGDPRP